MDGENIKDEIPEFHNLTRIGFGYLDYTKYWIYVLEVLKHCPKLQNLSTRKVCWVKALKDNVLFFFSFLHVFVFILFCAYY